ncbi:MAG: hypothetical protein R3E65_01140 [Steroidobacteraceae bacterium]
MTASRVPRSRPRSSPAARTSTARSTSATQAARQNSVAELMRSLLLFLLDSGLPREALQALLATALDEAHAQRSSIGALRDHSAAISGLLFSWHHDRRYLDARACPRPLPLTGAGLSVERLALAHCDVGEADAVIARLHTHGLIRDVGGGRWVPSGPVAVFTAHDREVSGYIGETIAHLMTTVHANLALAQRRAGSNGRDRTGAAAEMRPADALLERAAMVRNLPAEHLDAFRHHIQEQGTAFLANVDEWLEAHRPTARRVAEGANGKSRAGRSGVTAGVHVFAFVDDVAPSTRDPVAAPWVVAEPRPARRRLRP